MTISSEMTINAEPRIMSDRCECGHLYGTHYTGPLNCAWCGCGAFVHDPEAMPKPYMGAKAPGAEEGRYL